MGPTVRSEVQAEETSRLPSQTFTAQVPTSLYASWNDSRAWDGMSGSLGTTAGVQSAYTMTYANPETQFRPLESILGNTCSKRVRNHPPKKEI